MKIRYMKYKNILIKFLVEFCRLFLGVTFIFSGIVKAIDPVGSSIKISEYLASFHLDFLQLFSLPGAINLAAIEFALGVCMLLGVYRRYASFLVLVLMLFMTPLTLYLALYNPVADCGCFGDALIISNWATFYKNVALLGAAIFVFIYNQRLFPIYTFKVYWFIAIYSYVFIVGFSLRNYWYLPIIDFRPYKVGINITEQMTIPEDAPQDEYEYTFIYEKNGVKKEFSIDNLPTDSTWNFVDREARLIKAGYVPPITDFRIMSFEDEDLTDQILSDTTGVFLLISPKLSKASEERIDEINNLYDYAVENNLSFYCLTGSDQTEVKRWIDYTGAEYPFLFVDEVTLKTVIRSNPGLVVLKGGTIMGKWHYNDFPQEENLAEFVKSSLNDTMEDKKDARLLTNILSFSVPLLFVWGYDYKRNRRKKELNNLDKK